MFLYNLYALVGTGTGVIPVTSGGTGLITIPTDGQLLIGNGTGYTLNTLGTGSGISVANGAGTITIANTGVLSFSGGTTGLTPVAAAVGVVVLGGTLIAANGGTGFASYAVGDLLYANTTTTLAKLADVATGNALISGGVGTAPSWGKIGLTTHVDGVLPIANGGTNATATPTAYGVSYGTGTAYAFTAAGTTGQILTATTSGAPTWAAPATSGTVTSVGLALPSQFTVTNSPVTSSGTLTGSWNTQTANYVLAGPTTGAAAAPTFRALVSTDIPALSYVSSVTGTSPVASSGGLTPAISLAAAYGDTLNPYAAKTAAYVLAGPTTGAATAPAFRALVATDIPSLAYVASVSGTTGRITSTGGTTPVIDLASGVATPGTTGSSTLIPVVTIDAYGRVTSITTAANPQGTVTSVTGTAPVVSSGGATPAISMAAANTSTNGYLTSTDWNTFNGKGSGTVTSVAALTLGTTGTDLTSTVANGTTTPVITLNVPTASASNRGALSSTDWSTFNGKQAALVSGTNIKTVNGTTLLGSGDVGTISVSYGGTGLTTLTTGYIPYGNGTGAFSSSSNLYFSGLNLGIGTSTPDIFSRGYGTTVGINDSGSSGAVLQINSASGYPAIELGRGSARKFVLNAQSTALQIASLEAVPMTFFTDNAERMRINATGGLLVGATSSFGSTFSMYQYPGATANGLGIVQSDNSSGGRFMLFAANSAQCGVIDRIGTTSAVVYTATSDRRLKENIVDAPSAIAHINAVKVRSYNWIDNGHKVKYGVIAQEFVEVEPDAVVQGDNAEEIEKTWSVDTSALVPAMIKAIQEQNQLITVLTARIEALESKGYL
jgi:hypothetical protein